MPVALKITCYLACVTALFLALFMEYSSKLSISKAVILSAQEPRPADYEVQKSVLFDKAQYRARAGLASAVIGLVIYVAYSVYLKTSMPGMRGSLLRFVNEVPLMLLILYTLMFVVIV
jgi:hypothetical protein